MNRAGDDGDGDRQLASPMRGRGRRTGQESRRIRQRIAELDIMDAVDAHKIRKDERRSTMETGRAGKGKLDTDW